MRNQPIAFGNCIRRRIVPAPHAPILGIDVGEDYLDLAMLSADRARLSHHRIPLGGIEAPATDAIAKRIAAEVRCDLRSGIALIDSPRTPRDLDCSSGKMTRRLDAPRTRVIDAALRELLRERFNGAMRPLSMFPTPIVSYFAGCIAHPGCKPHLQAIAQELFASNVELPRATSSQRLAGGTFTRFMLAGFAVFPALEMLGIRAFESYPDLQMRLWSGGVALAPKRMSRAALRVRREICEKLAAFLKMKNFETPRTLDQADAAVLALSAAASASTGSLIELHFAPEGGFAVAFDPAPNPPRA